VCVCVRIRCGSRLKLKSQNSVLPHKYKRVCAPRRIQISRFKHLAMYKKMVPIAQTTNGVLVSRCNDGGARANNDPVDPTSPEQNKNNNNNTKDPHLPHELQGTTGTSASSHGVYQRSSTVQLSAVSVSLWHSEAAEKPVKRVRTGKAALSGRRCS